MASFPLWYGTLALDDFNASASALVKKWKEIDVDASLPHWVWKPCCKMGVPSEIEGYLALEEVYHIDEGSQVQIDVNSDSEDVKIAEDATSVESFNDDVHVYDFHVVYNFSYKVPVLYFRGYQAGGQSLTLDEIKNDLPPHSLKVLRELKWTFITQEEHPHLSMPWFTLHPCGTSEWMKLLLEETKSTDKMVYSPTICPCFAGITPQYIANTTSFQRCNVSLVILSSHNSPKGSSSVVRLADAALKFCWLSSNHAESWCMDWLLHG